MTRAMTDGRVQRLPDDVVNTIAAGEVVERPASVVKELLENSLDAGATEIEIVLEQGGCDRITVIDDGHGMGFADARLCLDRHATSKIRDAEGLFALTTLGFRGEALPSIAAVSRLTLLTRVAGQEGVRVEVDTGVLRCHEVAAAAPGTRIDIEALFENLPARRKFLRRPATELSHVSEAVGRIALASPAVGFRLRHQGRVLLLTPPGADADDRLCAVLGKDARGHLHPFTGEHHGLRVHGYFGSPALTRRSAAKGLHLFVNGRWVRDRQVGHAVARCFSSLVDRGRSPVAVVFLEIPPDTVDVNVHPQKLEVRFSEGRRVYDAVVRVLGPAVAAAPWAGGRSRRYGLDPESRGAGDAANSGGEAYAEHRARVLSALERFGANARDRGSTQAREGTAPLFETGAGRPGGAREAEDRDAFFGALTVVGQLACAYIVCEGPEGLVVIDQHAAHERMAFERLKARQAAGALPRQHLLVPRTLELGVAQLARLEVHLPQLAEAGFETTLLSEDTLAIRAVPAALLDRPVEEVIRDFLEEMDEVDESFAVERAMDRLLATVACHSVVRAGDPMTREAMEALVGQMDEVPRGANCPHGRPVAFSLSHVELEKRFGRR